MNRWIKRRHEWVLFVGTSRQASAKVRRSGCWVRAKVAQDARIWSTAPSVSAAKLWCEYQLRTRAPLPLDDEVWMVWRDGKIERRAVELRPHIMLHRILRAPHNLRELLAGGEEAASFPVAEEVVFTAQQWGEEIADPVYGHYERVRVVIYREDGAPDEVVEQLARRELFKKKMELGVGRLPSHLFGKEMARMAGVKR